MKPRHPHPAIACPLVGPCSSRPSAALSGISAFELLPHTDPNCSRSPGPVSGPTGLPFSGGDSSFVRSSSSGRTSRRCSKRTACTFLSSEPYHCLRKLSRRHSPPLHLRPRFLRPLRRSFQSPHRLIRRPPQHKTRSQPDNPSPLPLHNLLAHQKRGAPRPCASAMLVSRSSPQTPVFLLSARLLGSR